MNSIDVSTMNSIDVSDNNTTMSNELRYKSAPSQLLTIESAKGIVEMIVSVYGNVDSYNERIVLGFFDESIAAFRDGSKHIAGLFYHDKMQPIASTLALESWNPYDQRLPEAIKANGGLYVKAQFNLDTQVGRETYSNITKGLLNEYSIGFTVSEATPLPDGVIELRKGELFEWSSVLWGANELTTTLDKKSLDSCFDVARESATVLLKRLENRVTMRVREGRTLSSATVARINSQLDSITQMVNSLEEVAQDMRDLLATASPSNEKSRMAMEAVRQEFLTKGF